MKPQINDSGLVALEITQEVSSLGDNVKVAGQDFASINKTESTTNLVAQDGETILVGGLNGRINKVQRRHPDPQQDPYPGTSIWESDG